MGSHYAGPFPPFSLAALQLLGPPILMDAIDSCLEDASWQISSGGQNEWKEFVRRKEFICEEKRSRRKIFLKMNMESRGDPEKRGL